MFQLVRPTAAAIEAKIAAASRLGGSKSRFLTCAGDADGARLPLGFVRDRRVSVVGGEERFLLTQDSLQRPDGLLLHLTSRERLSTHFNGYAGLWTDAVMRAIQEQILQVIQKRCEGVRGAETAPISAVGR